MKQKLLAVAIAAALALSVSCAKPGGGDDSIANNVKAALYSDQTTKAANIAVAVKDGQVTLSGDVPNSDVALQAMKIANGTPGVKGVSDQLTINGASAANQLPDVGNTNGAPPPPQSNPNAPGNPPPPMASASPYAPPVAGEHSARREEPDQPAELTVPAGDEITVRTIEAIDSQAVQPGQTFRATVANPVRVDGRVAIPAGADATLEIAHNQAAGRIAGKPVLEVRLISINEHGERYRVDTSLYEQQGESRTRQTAIRTGVGAAAGAVIGALAGHGKGAAIGSLAGGGAGLGSDFFTKGPRVNIPSETLIAFRLQQPLTIQR